MKNAHIPPGQPKYRWIAEEVRRAIRDNRLGPRNEMVADNHLMRRYGVSRSTVRQAMDILVAEGLVVRQVGRGTFVREPAAQCPYAIHVVGRNLGAMLADPYIIDILFGVETEAALADIPLAIHPGGEEELASGRLAAVFAQGGRRNGIILLGPLPEQPVRALIRQGAAVVAPNTDIKAWGGGSVLSVMHHPSTIAALVERLYAAGHRRIAVIGWNIISAPIQTMQRRGVVQAMRKHRLAAADVPVQFAAPTPEGVAAVLDGLLAGPRPPTGIAFLNELLMRYGIEELRRRGLRVPADVSVNGFATVDFDLAYAGFRLNQREEGRLATRMLIRLLKDPAARPERVVMETPYNEGTSIGPPAR